MTAATLKPGASRPRFSERTLILALTLLALALRVWWLDRRGLTYDEAFTALIARASVAEIVIFHWTAAFEHTPLWALTMRLWSTLVGQREFALRFFPVLAGVLSVPLFWNLLRRMARPALALRVVATVLLLCSPVLVEYSQKSRMYSSVLLLVLLNLHAVVWLLKRPGFWPLAAFVATHWAMHSFHYYSALLLVAEAIFFAVLWLTGRLPEWRTILAAGLLSALPLALWLLLSPGFHDTAAVVLELAPESGQSASQFVDRIWRDLLSGHQDVAEWERLMLIALAVVATVGLVDLVAFHRQTLSSPQRPTVYWGWFLAALLLTPVLFSMWRFRTLPARYILFVMPVLYIFVAQGVVRLWAWARPLGALGLLVALMVAGGGLGYFFQVEEKMQYREMAAYLSAQIEPSDAVLLEGPRQHLLTKYYLDQSLPIFPVPNVELPAYTPITAPLVVPEEVDRDVRAYMQDYRSFWLILSAQNEVDPGEFVLKYLTAVAHKEDCYDWFGVQLCRFVSPNWLEAEAVRRPVDATFGGELRLENALISTPPARASGERYILVQLDWRAEAKPSKDYKVTLRLQDGSGRAVHQRDDFPMGTLIMPSTWNPDDSRSSFMALELPQDTPLGEYQIVVGLYDPETLQLIPYRLGTGDQQSELIALAAVEVGDVVTVVE